MRFLVDECTGPAVAERLREQSHDVFSVYQDRRGMSDEEILSLAASERRILITNDKDFGEMVFRERRCHFGVVLLRLRDERNRAKIQAIDRLISGYGDQLAEDQVRFASA